MNKVTSSKEYGLVCAVFWGQTKWIAHGPVEGSAAIVHNGTVDYVR